MTTLLKRKHILAASKSASTVSFNLISSIQFGTGGASGGTTNPIDTTSANIIVVVTSCYTPGTLSDSKGNTWITLTNWASTDGSLQIFYVINPIVGTNHTFTMSGASVYPTFFVYAFKSPSTPVFQSEVGNITGGSPLQTGSITPTKAGALIVTGLGTNNATSPLITTPGFIQFAIPFVGSVCMTGAIGYLFQLTAAPINPTWTWVNNPTASIATAVFLPS